MLKKGVSRRNSSKRYDLVINVAYLQFITIFDLYI